jgi:hypothetical protein
LGRPGCRCFLRCPFWVRQSAVSPWPAFPRKQSCRTSRVEEDSLQDLVAPWRGSRLTAVCCPPCPRCCRRSCPCAPCCRTSGVEGEGSLTRPARRRRRWRLVVSSSLVLDVVGGTAHLCPSYRRLLRSGSSSCCSPPEYLASLCRGVVSGIVFERGLLLLAVVVV